MYAGNPLIEALGPILDSKVLARRLTHRPEPPRNLDRLPPLVRLHESAAVRGLHIPGPGEVRFGTMFDLMLRQGYVGRNPHHPATWGKIYQRATATPQIDGPSDAAIVTGISGVGKTASVSRLLAAYPQVIAHSNFPHFIGEARQLVWLKADAPESGSLSQLVQSLINATGSALGDLPIMKGAGRNRGARERMGEWLAVAKSHSLGVLVIDEVQNFFKAKTLRERRTIRSISDRRELRLVEQETVRFLLTMTNTWGIPVLLMGTPDGVAALQTRFSTAQRLATGGYHEIKRPGSADDQFFKNYLLPSLADYQWFEKKLLVDDEIRQLIYSLTAGVPRILIALWRAAHVCAIERGAGCLTPSHFKEAADTLLAPLKPAVKALALDDPVGLLNYEDLIAHDTAIKTMWKSI